MPKTWIPRTECAETLPIAQEPHQQSCWPPPVAISAFLGIEKTSLRTSSLAGRIVQVSLKPALLRASDVKTWSLLLHSLLTLDCANVIVSRPGGAGGGRVKGKASSLLRAKKEFHADSE
jgi:hypothetical protein